MSAKSNLFFLTLFSTLNLHAEINSGLWSTDCLNGLKKRQTYEKGFVSTDEIFHQDRNCEDLSFTFTTTGTVSYIVDEPLSLNFVYDRLFLTLSKETLIEDFNARSVCGINRWTSEPMEITGLKCALFSFSSETQIPRSGDVRYGIFSVENDRLYYGQLSKNFDSSTPARRPQELNRTTVYIFRSSP